MSEHEWEDVCVTGVEHEPLSGHLKGNTIRLQVDPKLEPDGDPITYIILKAEDVAEIARYLDLVVYEKDSAIGAIK